MTEETEPLAIGGGVAKPRFLPIRARGLEPLDPLVHSIAAGDFLLDQQRGARSRRNLAETRAQKLERTGVHVLEHAEPGYGPPLLYCRQRRIVGREEHNAGEQFSGHREKLERSFSDEPQRAFRADEEIHVVHA